LGLPFHGYVAGGAEDDHEGARLEDALVRVRQGMKPMLRLASAWNDVADQVRSITEMGLDPRHFILCADDIHSETLVMEGHMDRAVKEAITRGLKPVTAIQMATINTAEHFGVARDVGLIAPGRFADILLVSDLTELSIEKVIAKGKVAAEGGQLLLDLAPFPYPDWATKSVFLGRQLTAQDFRLTSSSTGTVTANVIGVIENQVPTRHLRLEVPIEEGEVRVDMGRDLAKVALVERHKGTGCVQVGLVQGLGFDKRCAIGSTVAHDSHHMIVVGTDEADMAMAANELAQMGGGQVVIREGKIIANVPLQIAGLMSNENAEVVAEKAASVLRGFEECGCRLTNPNMHLSFLALVVIPELRISDLGLVDVTKFEFIPVLEE
jgi:adenine deaminase